MSARRASNVSESRMKTLETRKETMGLQQLLQQIGQKGDALLNERLPRVDEDGIYVPLRANTNQTPLLTGLLMSYANESGRGGIFITIMALPVVVPLDLLQLILRCIVYPLILAAWWCERRLSRLLGRSYFCPLCSNPMGEPLVYCEHCRRVQTRLIPLIESLFTRTCDCGKTTWRLQGQYLWRRPQPLVCRDTEHISGCYRPHALPDLAGKTSSHHLAIAGTTTRAKHAVMAYLFRHLIAGGSRLGPFRTAWDMSALELQLCDTLAESFSFDTGPCEQPGKRYTLSLSFVLRPHRGGRLLVFHNVAQPWLASTPLLAKNVLNWKLIPGLVFVVDPDRMGVIHDPNQLPQSEIFSRLLRVIEEYCFLPAGAVLSQRVAVVLPLPSGPPSENPEPSMGDAEVRRQVWERDPALYALLVESVKAGRLRFFAGPIPRGFDLEQTRWLNEVLAWLG